MRIGMKYGNIFLMILLFSIEFDVPISGFLTLRKIGTALLLLLYLYQCQKEGIKIHKETNILCIALSVIFLYTLWVVNIYSNVLNNPNAVAYNSQNILIMILYIAVFPFMLATLFDGTLQFARCQWYITLFQSTLVLIGRIFLNIRLFVFYHFSFDDGRLLEGVTNGIRSVGIDLAGSTGSIVLFSGLMCGIYLFFHSNIKEKKRILIGYFCVLASLLFMGRLGLYYGVIGLIIICLNCILHRDPCIRMIVGLMVLGIAAIMLYITMSPDSWGLQTWVRWITEFTHLFDEKSTIAVIRGQNIPPLTLETLFGTGAISGATLSGITLNHDAGYIRMYTAIGLIGCIMYYGTIYSYYLIMIKKVKGKTKRWIYIFFIIAVAVAEMKEPFLGKTPLPIILSCMLLLELSEHQTTRFVKTV